MVNIKNSKLVECDYCKKTIYKRPSELKGNKTFCSLKCNYAYKKGKIRVPYRKCKQCGGDIKLRSIKIKYCSRKCYGKSRQGSKLSETVRQKMSEGNKGTQKGKLNNNWKGGLTEGRNRDYSSIGYRLWRDEVFKRDNYTCRNLDCLKKSDGNKIKINAHHVLCYSEYPQFRKQIWNGITLCGKCHKLIHRKNHKKIKISGGTVEITEVFKIKMKKRPKGISPRYNAFKLSTTSLYFEGVHLFYGDDLIKIQKFEEDLAKKDGFNSAEQMFKTLDKMYDLSSPKEFWVYRWKWLRA